MSYRSEVQERDLSGFILASNSQIGAMVVKSSKGPTTPVLCLSETDVFTYFGYPSSDYPSMFEPIAFTQESPCWVVSAVGDNALYGGVKVSSGSIEGFTSGVASPSDYDFDDDTSISHAIFTSSPWSATQKVTVESLTGYQFKVTLYDIVGSTDRKVSDYTYSLIKEQDNFGKSLYFEDVFYKNPYLQVIKNSSSIITSFSLAGVTKYTLSGGSRGDTPETSHYTTAWDYFKKKNKYPAKIFMDVTGSNETLLNTIVSTYQPFSFGLCHVPLGSTYDQAISYRQGLSIDSDNVALYTNWAKILDPYNNSFAYINHLGSVGKKLAQMGDVYDSLSPAGIDEDGHGGQISDWKVIEVENDYSEIVGGELQLLDEAQINPIIFDEQYGVMIYGDKTLQVSLSDTSYIGTRRIYNLILDTVQKQVLKKQEFKNNDEYHRFKAYAQVNDFLLPIVRGEYVREALVICDTTNNSDDVLERREFVLDIYIKATPNSQKTLLRLTRVSQTQVIAELL